MAQGKHEMMSRTTLMANLAQALANVLFGAASVVSQLGEEQFNAVFFGLLRALITTFVLLALKPAERLLCCGPLQVRREDIGRFMMAGCCLFIGEFFYLLGVQFAGSIRASLWQPSQPIWTMALTWILGHERLGFLKGCGILFAFAGCVVMVVCRVDDKSHDDDGQSSFIRSLLGNLFLFINCSVGTPLYIVTVKPLLREYPPFSVAGLTFAVNSVFFGITMALSPLVYSAEDLAPPVTAWAWASVVYVAVVATVLPYALQLWATKILPASLVSAYYVLQPVAAAALVYTLLALHLASKSLSGAQLSDLGSLAVLAGLAVVIYETPQKVEPHTVDEAGRFLDANLASPPRGGRRTDGSDPAVPPRELNDAAVYSNLHHHHHKDHYEAPSSAVSSRIPESEDLESDVSSDKLTSIP